MTVLTATKERDAMQHDYHVRGSMLESLPDQAEQFVCGVAAMSKRDAAGYVNERLSGDGYCGIIITSVVTLPKKSTLPFGQVIHYGTGE